MAYEIGYKRPPKSAQFRKGESGNPKGRPKGSRNFLTLLDAELAHTVIVNENGRRRKVTRMQAIAKRIVADALQGDRKAQLMLVDVLRRSNRLEPVTLDAILPDDYESILENYVATRQKSTAGNSKQGD